MSVRSAILCLVLGVPAVGLLVFGPRRSQDVPPGRTVIHYWEKWSGVEGLAMGRIVDRFNATVGAEQNIWVDYFAVSNVDRRTLIATAGGDPPDVAGLYDYNVAQFADRGALLALDDLVEEFGIDPDAFKPAWWRIGMYNGTLYALPSAPYTIALYYNKRLFRRAGLDPDRPPQTIAELNEYSRRLTVRDEHGRIVQAGFIPAPKLLGWWHWVWPYFFGGQLWDGTQFTLDTPAGRAACRWIAAEREHMGFEDALAFEAIVGAVEGTQNPFVAERVAMVYQGPWVSNWVKACNPSLDYGVARFPADRADRKPVFASSDVFVIPRGSAHPREAMTFLAYLLRRDVMEELCREHCKLSPFRTPGPQFFASHPNPYIRTFDELAASGDTFGYPKLPTWQEASEEMLFMLESILQGLTSPDEAVRAAQRKIETVVGEYDRRSRKRRLAGGKAGL